MKYLLRKRITKEYDDVTPLSTRLSSEGLWSEPLIFLVNQVINRIELCVNMSLVIYFKHFESKWFYWKRIVLMQLTTTTHISNLKVGVRVPLRSRHFLSQKLWNFHKNTLSCVENECCCLRTVNISNINFTSKHISNRWDVITYPALDTCFGQQSLHIWTG